MRQPIHGQNLSLRGSSVFETERFSADEIFGQDVEPLSARQREIFWLLAEGYIYREIGKRLGISLSTVRAHVHLIYRKLRVESRGQMLAKLLQTQTPIEPQKNSVRDVAHLAD